MAGAHGRAAGGLSAGRFCSTADSARPRLQHRGQRPAPPTAPPGPVSPGPAPQRPRPGSPGFCFARPGSTQLGLIQLVPACPGPVSRRTAERCPAPRRARAALAEFPPPRGGGGRGRGGRAEDNRWSLSSQRPHPQSPSTMIEALPALQRAQSSLPCPQYRETLREYPRGSQAGLEGSPGQRGFLLPALIISEMHEARSAALLEQCFTPDSLGLTLGSPTATPWLLQLIPLQPSP